MKLHIILLAYARWIVRMVHIWKLHLPMFDRHEFGIINSTSKCSFWEVVHCPNKFTSEIDISACSKYIDRIWSGIDCKRLST